MRGFSNQALMVMFLICAFVVPLYGQETAAPQTASAQLAKLDQSDVDNATSIDVTKVSSDSELLKPRATEETSKTYVFPTPSARFKRYTKSMVGPFSLLYTGFGAALNQWRDEPDEWEQGMSGYGKRFASGFGRNAIQQTVTYGLDMGLKLDTGFRKSEHKEFGPRLKDALLANITSRTHSGKRVISVPRLAGVYTGSIIAAETWYPARYNYKDGLRNGTGTLLTGFGINLIREFLFNW